MNWWNNYLGLPYQPQGRTREGLDCWGLVRMVYEQEFGIDLPSFTEAYSEADLAKFLRAVQQEGWVQADLPRSGDVVLCRVVGSESHVGVVTYPGFFLHVREGQDSVIERMDSGAWKSRIVGVYRYTPADAAYDVISVPHPLRTQRIDGQMPHGMNLSDMAKGVREAAGISDEVFCNAVIMVDGEVVPETLWATTVPPAGARVEYRAVAGKSKVLRLVAVIAVSVFAGLVAPGLISAMGMTTAAGFSAGAIGIATTAAIAGINMVGGLLINSIFPVRPPDLSSMAGLSASDPGQANAQALLQGANNSARHYGAIPVVLGQYRYTAPLGAVNYTESDATASYLRMILVWGYGPLQVSDIRVGDTDISAMEAVEVETLTGVSGAITDRFTSLYGRDASQEQVSIKLEYQVWTEKVLNQDVDSLSLTLHFPEGLRAIAMDGAGAGGVHPTQFLATVQIRQLDSDNLTPLTDWGDVAAAIPARTLTLQPSFFNTAGDGTLSAVYQWTRISVDEYGKVITRSGAYTESQYAEPSGSLLLRQQQTSYGVTSAFARLPPLGTGEEELWQVCVFGSGVITSLDMRGTAGLGVTGCGLTAAGLLMTVAAGSISRAQSNTLNFGLSGGLYYQRKDAFTHNVSFSVAYGTYEVRVRRDNGNATEYSSGGVNYRRYHDAYFISVTGFSNIRPINPPKPLAMSAIRVKATNQINGNIDGISATVVSICKDWDSGTSQWVVRPTRNPASLFRYILQHPANAQAIADSGIDLVSLQAWHTYCATNAFMYDAVVSQQRSLLDVLRDVAAAGRGSPTRRDGVWSILVDQPRMSYSQFFTPRNSWGFEGVRALPKMPHGFRVQFSNSTRGYQPDERIVYNDGYSSANATLLEGLSLPGVTTTDAIFKHARFHLAQIKLRPETYTLNVDIEHLVCTRGDLVKVVHDVPLWGIGSARIRDYIDSTHLVLDEEMPMVAATQYTVRIRLADGSSITRTVAAVGSDGHYSTITLTAPVTALEGEPDNLLLFGTLNSESVDCVVMSIEPSDNMTAQITLADYSPAVYDSDLEAIPAFDSHITLPTMLQQKYIPEPPIITLIVSDESVMTRLSPSQFSYAIKVSYTNPANLPMGVTSVEAQMDYADDATLDWQTTSMTPLKVGAVVFNDVQEGATYHVRLRYVDAQGRTSAWATVQAHTVVGKTTPPSQVGVTSAEVEGTNLRLNWPDNAEIDVYDYEVRATDFGWGEGGHEFRGLASTCLVQPNGVGTTKTWYIRARDIVGLVSTASRAVDFTVQAPVDTSGFNSAFETSLTSATILLSWADVTPVFGLSYYELTYDSVVKTVKSNSIVLPADWLGSRVFTVKVVDLLGNKSAGVSTTVTKLAPGSPTAFRAQVIDNTVMLYWDLPVKTSLAVDHIALRKGATWETAADIGDKKGGFTTISEIQGGVYTYWAAAVDTDNRYSTPAQLTANVAEPPDFVFNGEFTSDFSATKVAAYNTGNALLMPVNTTETWAQHFTSNSWSTPQDQVSAGFPIYIQPAEGTGYYEQVFDFGTVFASSRVTLSFTGTVVSSPVTVTPDISVSADGSAYTLYANTSDIYATTFRYVKARITATEVTGTGLYELDYLSVRLDAKLISDAGSTTASASDTNGTVINFAKEFLDITSLTVSPGGTTPVSAVYDLHNSVMAGTYSVTSNVCTVNFTAHGFVTGQNIQLRFTSGAGVAGVYTITGTTTDSYTVAMTVANTSGNYSAYPQSFLLYLFNSAGARVSGPASWSVKGY